MSTEENEAIFRRYIEEVGNKGNLDFATRSLKVVQTVTGARIMAGAYETTTLLIKLGDPRPVSEGIGTGAWMTETTNRYLKR
ncbi:MAG TPA: hypothetical protein VF068_09700 [Rubrobacter sp.]